MVEESYYRGYTRVSTKEQSDNSLEVQKVFLQNRAKEYNLKFKLYSEKKSGKNTYNRNELNKLLKDVQPGDICGFYDNSRMGRDSEDNVEIAKTIDDKRAQVEIGGRIVNWNMPSDKFIFLIENAVSQYQRDSILQKSRAGIDVKHSKGDWIFTGKLFGYEYKNGKIYVEKDEAKIIKHLFEQYANGKSINEISKEVTAKNWRTRKGFIFHAATLRRYILKPIYMGYYPKTGPGGKVGMEKVIIKEDELTKSNKYAPIVDKDLWFMVYNSYRNITRKHSRQFYFRWSRYELTSVMKCYYCGKTYVHNYHKSRAITQKVNSNYTCRNHLKNCSQTRHTFRGEVVESLFRSIFKIALIYNNKLYSFLNEQTKDIDKSKESLKTEIDEYNNLKKSISDKIKSTTDAIVLSPKSISLHEKLSEFEADKIKTTDRISALEDDLNNYEIDADLLLSQFSERTFFKFFRANEQEKRNLYLKIIESCMVKDNRIIISFIHDIFMSVKLHRNRGSIIQKHFPISIYFRDKDDKKKLRHIIKVTYDYDNDKILLPEKSVNDNFGFTETFRDRLLEVEKMIEDVKKAVTS